MPYPRRMFLPGIHRASHFQFVRFNEIPKMEARLFHHFIIRDRNNAPLVILFIDPFLYLNDALVILRDLIIPFNPKRC